VSIIPYSAYFSREIFIFLIADYADFLLATEVTSVFAEATPDKEYTEGFGQPGVLGKSYSQSKLCHKILPSSTKSENLTYLKLTDFNNEFLLKLRPQTTGHLRWPHNFYAAGLKEVLS